MLPSDAQLLDGLLDSSLQARWRRSRAGNLWTTWGLIRRTVFKRGRLYFWCVCRPGEELQWSRQGYVTEEDAVEAMWAEEVTR